MRVLVLTLLLLAARASAQPCDDAELSEAAASLLSPGAATPSPNELSDAARLAGSNAVALRILRVTPGDDAALAAFTDGAREREGALFVCGEAESESARLRIVGRRGARLAAPLVADGRAIDVSLSPAIRRAVLVVRGVSGATLERELTRPSTRVLLPDGLTSAFAAQVVATDDAGPRPVAELSLGAPQAEPDEEGGDASPAAHVARLRRHASVPPLRGNAILDRLAAAHARAVCADGRVTHEEEGEDPVARVRRAGLEARWVGEVVARASSRREALAGLDASPSHRIALEDSRFTDAGFGEATLDAGHACVVVLLAAWPRFAGR